jgi:hypothetical protein
MPPISSRSLCVPQRYMNAISGGSWAVESFEPINEAALAIGGITGGYPLDPDAEVDSVLLDGRSKSRSSHFPSALTLLTTATWAVHHRCITASAFGAVWRNCSSRQKRMVEPNPAVRDGKKYGNNSWAIIAAYFDEAAAQTAAQVTRKYLGTLAAVDVFAKDNAYSIFEFALREDAGMLGPFGVRG